MQGLDCDIAVSECDIQLLETRLLLDMTDEHTQPMTLANSNMFIMLVRLKLHAEEFSVYVRTHLEQGLSLKAGQAGQAAHFVTKLRSRTLINLVRVCKLVEVFVFPGAWLHK